MRVTNQKALEYMKNIRIDFNRIEQAQEAMQVADLCVIALEKQIPMKPKRIDYQCVVCNNCDRAFDEVVLGLKVAYCPHCGQAINWSEEE